VLRETREETSLELRPDQLVGDGALLRPSAPEREQGIPVDWVGREQLFSGPFGEYNRNFFRALGL
jgi:hypothetical protein